MNRKQILCSLFIDLISLAIAIHSVFAKSPPTLVVAPPRRLYTPPPKILTVADSHLFDSSLLQWMLLPYLGVVTLVWKLSCTMRSAVVRPQHSPGRAVQGLGRRYYPINTPPITPSSPLVNEQILPTEAVEPQTAPVTLTVVAKPLAQPLPLKRLWFTPAKPGYAHVQWDIAEIHRQALKNQGGKHLMLRIQDVTSFDHLDDIPLSVQTYICAEADWEKHVAIPVSNHDYIAELGYFTEDYRWLSLHQSDVVHMSAMVS